MLSEELELVYESVEESGDYESVVKAIDPEWIEQSLLATSKASIRRRRLPAEQAVWLVIWMGLIRNQSIKEVCSSMDLALQTSKNNEWSRVAPSVITDCRRRLSDSPMNFLTAFDINTKHGVNRLANVTAILFDFIVNSIKPDERIQGIKTS